MENINNIEKHAIGDERILLYVRVKYRRVKNRTRNRSESWRFSLFFLRAFIIVIIIGGLFILSRVGFSTAINDDTRKRQFFAVVCIVLKPYSTATRSTTMCFFSLFLSIYYFLLLFFCFVYLTRPDTSRVTKIIYTAIARVHVYLEWSKSLLLPNSSVAKYDGNLSLLSLSSRSWASIKLDQSTTL